ncbi:MAG: prolyl oligopeptidase family serine peptidase [candidate division Zixibacteria bacterium]|nr:prolyl oligopeptidase family serine peptidase [candidate division Zixibacteria bacterium]
MQNGDIVTLDRVVLSGRAPDIVRKMYSEKVLDDTIVERLTYISDGLKVKGCVARPSQPGKCPVLIWNRGGSFDRGALDDLRAYLVLASTAVWGYVVLATHYRGNKGGEGEEDWAGSDVNDALNLLKVAEQMPDADTDRVAIEGASRGGMTTYRALTMDDRFRCAIVHAGIADLVALEKQKKDFSKFLHKLFGHLPPEEKLHLLKSRSAVYFADKLPRHTPILIMHGTHDERVPLEQSIALVEQLERFGIPHRLEILEGAGHAALKDGSYKEIDRLRFDWLHRHLR